METASPTTLEQALAKTESDADAALKAATAVVSSLKKFRTAAQTGNLRELRKMIEASERAIAELQERFTNAKEGWILDEDTYISNRAFVSEILEAAKQIGLRIFEQDDRLYCYPFLIRLMPNERVIMIEKTREKRLRPSVFASHMKELQNKPVKFRSEAFLESLFSSYSIAIKTRGKELLHAEKIIPLVEIYDLLTLLPSQSKEYSRQEFARDLYLLDQSGVITTKSGMFIAFHAARGSESPRRIISIVTRDGQVRKYFGISFTQNR